MKMMPTAFRRCCYYIGAVGDVGSCRIASIIIRENSKKEKTLQQGSECVGGLLFFFIFFTLNHPIAVIRNNS